MVSSATPTRSLGRRVRWGVSRLYRLLEYLLLIVETPKDALLIVKLLFTNRPYLGEWLRFSEASWLVEEDIKTVIDVGAYTGSLCFGIARQLPDAHIYAFDPLPDNFERLQLLANDIKLTPFNVAVGASEGAGSFFRNSFSASSSALPIMRKHIEAFPETAQVEEIAVKYWQLDAHLDEFELNSRVLLVLDVQGFELQALKGAELLLRQVDLVLCEVSFAELYENQCSFEELYDFLRPMGFVFKGDAGHLRDPHDGRILQVDALFIREGDSDE
jgi:FkbM family methyltransferase